jgi:hypothetical protein
MIRPTGSGARMGLRSARRCLLYPLLSVMMFAPIFAAFYWPAGNGLDVTGHPIGRDFINVWAGPQLAFGGKLATLFDLRAYHLAIGGLFGQPLPFHNWGYPLFTLLAFWPLAQLPYWLALTLWTGLFFACFAAVTVSQIDPAKRLAALVVLLLAPACLINAVGGQNGFLSAALFLGGVLLIDRRPAVAGILFGLLAFKPHLGIVLPFALLTLGAWRVIGVAAVTAVVLIGCTIPIFGVDAWRQYLDVAGAFQLSLLQNFQGFYTIMMASVLSGLRMSGAAYSVALPVQLVASGVALGLACWAVRRTRDACLRALVLATAAVLVTPYAFNYDLTAVMACLVWAMFGRLPWRADDTPIYLVAWVAPVIVMYLGIIKIGIAPIALLALFWIAVREAVRDGIPDRQASTGIGDTPASADPGAVVPAGSRSSEAPRQGATPLGKLAIS